MKKLLSLAFLFVVFLSACGDRDTTYDSFTQCLADSGTKYYGAFWCPNCQNQAKLFGDSKDLLPYIECDANGKDAQPAVCKKENVISYPTWKFPDGTVKIGTQQLSTLSELSLCALPGEESILLQE